QIARARVMNASPRRIMNTFEWRFMIAAMTGSRFARARLARSQYSGFMQREIQEEVLRLDSHQVAFVARNREVDGPSGDVAPHDCGVGELEVEEREDAPHLALLHLAAVPQLVQNRGRLGIEADVPGPALFLDLADRPDLDCRFQEVKDPGFDDARQ